MKYKNFVSTNLPCAWIVNPKDRGRKSIKNGKVYLDNGQEFEIEIFNPLQESVLSVLKINGISASEGGLVIRPGQRFYLDCFIDIKKKFIFNTYEVENTPESKQAIERNGFVEVSFYKERKSISGLRSDTTIWWEKYGNGLSPTSLGYINSDNIGWDSITYGGTSKSFTINTNFGISGSSGSTNCFYTSNLGADTESSYTTNQSSIETGRIEGGNVSNQNFINVDMNFENFPISQISYQIMPTSLKPVETKELKKKFCTECGRKTKESFKFCPDCGVKI